MHSTARTRRRDQRLMTWAVRRFVSFPGARATHRRDRLARRLAKGIALAALLTLDSGGCGEKPPPLLPVSLAGDWTMAVGEGTAQCTPDTNWNSVDAAPATTYLLRLLQTSNRVSIAPKAACSTTRLFVTYAWESTAGTYDGRALSLSGEWQNSSQYSTMRETVEITATVDGSSFSGRLKQRSFYQYELGQLRWDCSMDQPIRLSRVPPPEPDGAWSISLADLQGMRGAWAMVVGPAGEACTADTTVPSATRPGFVALLSMNQAQGAVKVTGACTANNKWEEAARASGTFDGQSLTLKGSWWLGGSGQGFEDSLDLHGSLTSLHLEGSLDLRRTGYGYPSTGRRWDCTSTHSFRLWRVPLQ